MSRPRKEPGLKQKLAAALREIAGISMDHARLMHADQIISLFHFHHIEYHAQDGADEHWNLDPLLIAPHKERTAKIDIPQIAKTKRLSKEHEEFQRRILTPRDERPKKKGTFPPSRKMQSRPFPSQKAKP